MESDRWTEEEFWFAIASLEEFIKMGNEETPDFEESFGGFGTVEDKARGIFQPEVLSTGDVYPATDEPAKLRECFAKKMTPREAACEMWSWGLWRY